MIDERAADSRPAASDHGGPTVWRRPSVYFAGAVTVLLVLACLLANLLTGEDSATAAAAPEARVAATSWARL